ncbi:N-acetylgalactosamine-6-sulfatase [Lutibacter sp. HS1-25]|uniref:arylsulfatase n=1 Tax=Lutibacter sp. HS1-25 TaxID=2485000 RepID=UPI00101263E8|nr:arylsulfatase [Lutibacter sp. HS1-25]RXP62730.1 N-acetylgalactosamine-6-sulfatase [Lutibacter sp. HS1-25]
MKYQNFMKAAVIVLLVLVGCKENPKKEVALKEAANEKPNIVFILVDDMGYGDLGCYGQETLTTPNIDKLAAEGMRFTQHYAGSTVCAPSRASLLTGKHTGHTSVRGNEPEGQLLEDDEITIAKMLNTEGYKSAVIGKWGVGNHPEPNDPARNGFEHAYGYVNMWHAHNFYPEFLYRDGVKEILKGNKTDWSYDYEKGMKEGTGVAKVKETYAIDKLQEDALKFIADNKSNPFFLYYCLNIPHANNEAGYFTGDGMEVPSYGEFESKDWPNPEKGFASTIRIIDNSVAEIEAKLNELGIAENTIVVFVSDNGPHNEGGHVSKFFDSNGIYRGDKRDLYEGGIRVPLIVKWPGKIKPGSVANNPVATWDFMSTFAEVVGLDTPENTDGVSFLPTLLGNTEEQKEHEYLYWAFYEQGGRQAIRVGDWKYIKLNVRDHTVDVVEELYNIKLDPSETNNVIKENPEKVTELSRAMENAHTEHRMLSLFSDEISAESKFQE